MFHCITQVKGVLSLRFLLEATYCLSDKTPGHSSSPASKDFKNSCHFYSPLMQ